MIVVNIYKIHTCSRVLRLAKTGNLKIEVAQVVYISYNKLIYNIPHKFAPQNRGVLRGPLRDVCGDPCIISACIAYIYAGVRVGHDRGEKDMTFTLLSAASYADIAFFVLLALGLVGGVSLPADFSIAKKFPQ